MSPAGFYLAAALALGLFVSLAYWLADAPPALLPEEYSPPAPGVGHSRSRDDEADDIGDFGGAP